MAPGAPSGPGRGSGRHPRHQGQGEALPSPPWRGDSVGTPFRLGLEERGLPYVLALHGKEVAHPEDVEPHQPAYGGLGPPTLPRYRTPPRAISTGSVRSPALSHIRW
ncbi:transposase [Streptomyces sp. ALI-76-A]|uniref:transposase n=1 Tax=Streptomyces sp. ALI-76-A TaxID=3025736 RepID=UPI003364DE9E